MNIFLEVEASIKSSYFRLVHIIKYALLTNVDLYYMENILFYLHEG
jgi:hypothetical protein